MRTLVVLAIVAASGTAHAQCPRMNGSSPALARRTNEERMEFILRRIQSGEEAARTWSTIFALGYLGLTAGQMAALSFTNDPEDRIDRTVAGVSALIGVATIVILPLDVLADRARVEALAPRARAGDCRALAQAEEILERDAASEEFGASWLIHVGSALFNVGIGLLLGLGFGHWVTAAISTGVGILVSELQILTQPTDLIDAFVRYRTGDFEVPGGPRVALAPFGSERAGGLALAGAF